MRAAEVADWILGNGRGEVSRGSVPPFPDVWPLLRDYASVLIDRGATEDGVRLVRDGERFAVFHTERGVRSDEVFFAGLEEAAREKAARLHRSFVGVALR